MIPSLSQKIARELARQAQTPSGLVPLSNELKDAFKEDIPSPFKGDNIRTIFSQKSSAVYEGDDLKKMKKFYEEVEEESKRNAY